jgi:hypothetical protein
MNVTLYVEILYVSDQLWTRLLTLDDGRLVIMLIVIVLCGRRRYWFVIKNEIDEIVFTMFRNFGRNFFYEINYYVEWNF